MPFKVYFLLWCSQQCSVNSRVRCTEWYILFLYSAPHNILRSKVLASLSSCECQCQSAVRQPRAVVRPVYKMSLQTSDKLRNIYINGNLLTKYLEMWKLKLLVFFHKTSFYVFKPRTEYLKAKDTVIEFKYIHTTDTCSICILKSKQ